MIHSVEECILQKVLKLATSTGKEMSSADLLAGAFGDTFTNNHNPEDRSTCASQIEFIREFVLR
jgi:hypothetical protein